MTGNKTRMLVEEAAMTKVPVAPQSATPVLELLPPYPIVLATTRSNVITVNQVAYFSFRPLRIGVAIAHVRYTYSLLKDEGEFVINIPDASLMEEVKICGSRSGRDGDKFVAAGLDREPSTQVQATSIARCGAHIECRVERTIPFERRDWFIGRVVAARKRTDHQGTSALMCGRHNYLLPGKPVAPR
jgi:flavin reductase (DIM6/NTAB) family NADH-FMN oxidoreductase RutF